MPIGMAISRLSRKAVPRTANVAGRRCQTRVRTLERDWKEVPHSPVAIDLAHLAYWTGRGSERPSCLRMLALTSSGTRGSAAKAANGSPGAREMMAKRTIEMATRVGTACTSRRMMYFPIAYAHSHATIAVAPRTDAVSSEVSHLL